LAHYLKVAWEREDWFGVVERAQDGVTFDPAALRVAVAVKLENAALPTELRMINKMPRNLTDKLDRGAVGLWYDAQAISDKS
jgi:hypothetical protein